MAKTTSGTDRIWRGVGKALGVAAMVALIAGCATTASGEKGVAANSPAAEADAKFAAFLRSFRATAIAEGIEPAVYDRSMAGLTRNVRVERANLEQPEFVEPIWDYLDTAVSAERVAKGTELLAEDAPMLAKLQQRFGVPARFLVAIWGMETDYGKVMGRFDMFDALATLAYAGPREDYGRRELIAALKMEQREHLDPAMMTSSWAGAFGQTQFVPTSFLTDAVDGDGDGRIDLWHSPADALASTALLLANAGWSDNPDCGYEVTLPAGFDYGNAAGDIVKTTAAWSALGVRLGNGDPLPSGERPASILLPAGMHGPAFIVFDNFNTILKYNNSQSYALAVCYLANRIAGGTPILASWPRQDAPLTRDERIAFQTDLKKLGYNPGDIDGLLGRKVRAALRAYQIGEGLPADGFPTRDLLERMERELAARGE